MQVLDSHQGANNRLAQQVLKACLKNQPVSSKLSQAFLSLFETPLSLLVAHTGRNFDLKSILDDRGYANASVKTTDGTSVAVVSLANARSLDRGAEIKPFVQQSYPFRTMGYIAGQFELAEFALDYTDKDPTRFKTLEFLKQKMKAGTNINQYLHPAIGAIVSYDKEHGTEWLKTLRSFLRNESRAQRTGEELFLHRNAVLYRLNRIQKVTGINLDDTEERAYLRASLMLWD